MAASDYKEYLLKTTAFSEPKVATGKEAIATLVTRLILMEPGTNPLHPSMGVGIISRYRFLSNSTMMTDLKNDITKQITQFLPSYQFVSVELVQNSDNTVDIQIQLDDTIFVYDSSDYVPITLSTISDN